MRPFFVFVVMLLLGVSPVLAANKFAVISGSWSSNIWSSTVGGAAGGAPPAAGDVVTINAGVVVDIDAATALGTTITINGTVNLTGTFDLQLPTTGSGGSLTVANGGTLTFSSGGQVLGGGNTGSGIAVTIASGATLKTANTLGFVTGTGNTTLTGSIAVRPGSKTISYNANVDYTFNGTAAQVTGNAVTAASDIIIDNPAGVTTTSSITASGVVTINSGATLSLGATTFSLSGGGTPFVNNGTLTPGTGTFAYTGASAQNITAATYNNLTFSGNGAKTVQSGDDVIVNGNWATGTAAVSLAGNSTMTVGANVSGSAPITMGSGILTLSGNTTGAFGNTGTFTRGTGTVIYNRAAAQTVKQTTYNNLTLAGTGTKTTTTVTVNGTLTYEGTATPSTAPTLGAAAGIVYNSTSARNATTAEWPATFAGTGGVTISGTGTVSMAATKALTTAPLIINTNATLNTATFGLTMSDDFINNGTLTTSSGNFTLTGSSAQSIGGGISTTGSLAITKSGGTATMQGNFTVRQLVVNTSGGGALNLGGAGIIHDVAGGVILSTGTGGLNGGSAQLDVAGTPAWAGTGTVFTPGTGTIAFTGTNQTLSASGTKTFYNLTYANSGNKNTSAGSTLVNNILSIEGTAAGSGTAATYGSAATLRYNTASNRSAGTEWLSTFTATGGVVIDNTGIISLNGDKILSTNAPFTIMPGATVNAGSFSMTFNSDFINNGSWTPNAGNVTITGTAATQNIAGFSTSGDFYMTKASGTATLGGDVNASDFYLNGASGVLDFGTGNTHTFAGNYNSIAGTVQANNSTMNLDANVVVSGGAFDAGTGLVHFRGNAAQVVPGITWYDLQLSGSGAKSFSGDAIVSNVFTVNPGATLNVGTVNLLLSGTGVPFVNNGTVNTGTSTIGYVGAGAQTVIPLNYYNLNTAGGARTFSNAGNIGVGGTFTPGSGAFTVSGSTFDFNGTTNQNIPAFTFDKLIVSNAGIKKILATIVVACQTIDINDAASVEIDADGLGRLNVLQ